MTFAQTPAVSTASAEGAYVECDVPTEQDYVAFVHRLGGDVDVIGFDAEGNRVGVIANPITADEVEVVDPTGTAVRLRATPATGDE